MEALLRFPASDGWITERGEIGEPAADGVVFASLGGGSFMPFRDTGKRTEDGVPIFDYAM